MVKVKVTRNFQVTIPEEVRKKVTLAEGDIVDIEPFGPEQIILKRIIPLEELEGAWANDSAVDNAMEEVDKLWKNWKIPKKSV